jgi:plasmid stability protein
MHKMIQIRNVPLDVHRTLKARAAQAGATLSDYLLSELEDLANRPTPEEMRARLEGRRPVRGGESSADAVRAVRTAR